MISGSGRPPGEGNRNPLQDSFLENSIDREAWWGTVHGVARVGHDLVTKPPTTTWHKYWVFILTGTVARVGRKALEQMLIKALEQKNEKFRAIE